MWRTSSLVRQTLRALTAALVAALIVAPLSAVGSAAPGCGNVFTLGAWTSIAAPNFVGGTPAITGYEVDPYEPSTIFVTNGTSVMVSNDVGCSWEPSLVLDNVPSPDLPLSGANTTIVDIAIPESSYAHTTIYLLAAEKVGPVTKPHVIKSTDGGSSWTLVDGGLPPLTGAVLDLEVAPDSPQFLYLLAQIPTGNDEMFASTDGGSSWERRTPLPPNSTATGFAIDPQNSNELWTWGGNLEHSTDGGRTRTPISFVPNGVAMVDVWHGAGSPARIMAYVPDGQTFFISVDGGRTWPTLGSPLPGNALSIAHGKNMWDVVFSQAQGVWQLGADGNWLDISPSSGVDIYDLQIDASGTNVFGMTPNSIELYSGLKTNVDLDPFEVNGAIPSGTGVPQLLPEDVKVKLKPGEKTTRRFNLALPPLPNPLDVFFLVDTSASMDQTIAGLRAGMQDIINDLASAGLDVQFGVGEIKDYPIPGYGEAAQGDFPYRLDRKIGPVDDALKQALQRLVSSGGGALDQPESQLTGLYIAATGKSDLPWVPAGQGAEFREGSTKVIVNITDAPFHDEIQHPSPPFATVAQALKDQEILQVGLGIFGANGARGVPDLKKMAVETETMAPEPVDCDGNGSDDLAEGAPLVCPVSDENYDGTLNLAPAIIATLKAVTQDVGVQLQPAGTEGLVAEIDSSLTGTINLKEPNDLGFDVTFSCPRSLLGKTRDVKLQAVVGEDTVATSTATVTCKPDPAAKKRQKKEIAPILAPAFGAIVVGIVAPPPPPPPVVEQMPGTQQMAQAQGAMATEEQEQLQVAVAKQRSRFQSAKEEIYEMSAYRESRPSPAPLYAAAAIMGLAVAGARSMRGRARVAVARRRVR